MDVLSVWPVVLKGLAAVDRIVFWPDQELSSDMDDLRSALLAAGVGAGARACTESEGQCNAVHVPKPGSNALGQCALLYGHVGAHQWSGLSDRCEHGFAHGQPCRDCAALVRDDS